MKNGLFFATSTNAARRLTNIFDFVWPTAAAMWNLRWQVSGLVAANGDLSEEELLGRFVTGSGIRGTNLRRACIEQTWEEQQSEFSRFLLFEFCALYEAWCEGCVQELGVSSWTPKSLQFPTIVEQGVLTSGVGKVLAQISNFPSVVLRDAFGASLSSNRKNAIANIEALLLCYRYFKESRNAIIHAGGTASPKFLEAEKAYRSLTPSSLGVKEVPVINRQALGSPISINLRGVVGLGDIVLRLVCTLDAKLAEYSFAEAVFVRRWRELHGRGSLTLAIDSEKRAEHIRRLVRKLGLPTPKVSPQLESWLKQQCLIA